jgi:hypothetical protein
VGFVKPIGVMDFGVYYHWGKYWLQLCRGWLIRGAKGLCIYMHNSNILPPRDLRFQDKNAGFHHFTNQPSSGVKMATFSQKTQIM